MAGPTTKEQQSVTAHLLDLPGTKELYPRATQSRFLELAGQGKLPRHYLSQWLSQDRLYAQAYVRFIGGLTSLVELPLATAARSQQQQQPGQRDTETSSTLEWRILEMLRGCLDNILRELKFFEDTAAQYGIDLASIGGGKQGHDVESAGSGDAFGPNGTTQGYINLFDSFGGRIRAAEARVSGERLSDKMLLLKGLVVLWTTEKVYLDAWLYAAAAGGGDGTKDSNEDEDGDALRMAFIPNWTSDEFKAFVEEIRVCLNQFATRMQHEEGHEDVVTAASEVFKTVLSLEEGFWPKVE
ncbi:uncharacterized protein B0I36DRAFT_317333 [Microdochium trichocladiopsis]|uniref:Thiaminase-2/PQQC domain-containing protein n=1 Tax=Microdochium trichocladiopsis TaxID=1682393 RepID=A0A9P8YB04_9PEZI|nr:uncharacterized protein B0I36DRAFT_317333 [Microdochium trichocladiopsis]KAH7034972.1 hypothetical protein B0I36DRAFT_317333 [Microdochium trichocladiopsis]